jgi:hypothetical protein
MRTHSISPAARVEMQLARLEVSLNLIEDYAKITHTTLIEVKAKQCLMEIEHIKKYLEKYG